MAWSRNEVEAVSFFYLEAKRLSANFYLHYRDKKIEYVRTQNLNILAFTCAQVLVSASLGNRDLMKSYAYVHFLSTRCAYGDVVGATLTFLLKANLLALANSPSPDLQPSTKILRQNDNMC